MIIISGLMSPPSDYRRALVASQFHRARRRAALESLLARLSGQPAGLLSYDEVVGKLGVSGQSSIGLQQIPIDAIVGSVGRYLDFTRTFLPRLEEDEDRWVRVGAAATTVADLPPIDVYKVGRSYFVLDGNHRVSLARQQRLAYIDAVVTEVRTRAPLPDNVDPEALIVAAEHGDFLQHTRLDIMRPSCDLRVSVPGQYRHLESHIEAHRFFVEADEEREMPYEEAVTRWYDDAYLPMIYAIREQGILRYFPGRTETDFFVWLARHRAELQNELGIIIPPDVAVARLAARVRAAPPSKRQTPLSRLRRLTGLTPPEPPEGNAPSLTWAQERTLDRYSDRLFASVLFPFVLGQSDGALTPRRERLEQAMSVADLERARFSVLCIIDRPDNPMPVEAAAIEDLRRLLASREVPAELVIEFGDPQRWTRDVGYLHDLIIVERSFDVAARGEAGPTAGLMAMIRAIRRPILVLGVTEAEVIPRKVLLVHDSRHALDEAIFIAAYLAERWNVDLHVLPLSNGRNTSETIGHIDDYLALHEVHPTYLEPVRPNDRAGGVIVDMATEGGFDLVLMTGPLRTRKGRATRPTGLIETVLHRWPRSVLVAT